MESKNFAVKQQRFITLMRNIATLSVQKFYVRIRKIRRNVFINDVRRRKR
jgi:hypothetical protein